MNKWFSCIVTAIRKGCWLPFLVFVLHEVCAHAFGNLYDAWPPLDIPMHFIGGFAIAYFASVIVRQCEEYGFITIHSDIAAAMFIFALTLSAAVFWEYAEWLSDHFIGTQSQKGLDDTLLDTVVGLLGGSLYILIIKGKRICRELFYPEY